MESKPTFLRFVSGASFLLSKAKSATEEISRDESIVAVVLFGSVAKNNVGEESDIDLLVITKDEMEERGNEMLHDLMFKYDVPLEGVFLTYDDLISHLQERSTFSLGLMEGYKVLFDRGGVEKLLSFKLSDILKDWVYEKETGTWLQRRLIAPLPQSLLDVQKILLN